MAAAESKTVGKLSDQALLVTRLPTSWDLKPLSRSWEPQSEGAGRECGESLLCFCSRLGMASLLE